MASDYPVSVPSHTVKTNGVDIIDADHINTVQDDIEAICNFVGASGAAQSHSAVLLAILQGNYVGGRIHKKSNTEIYVDSISAIVANSAESIRELKRVTTQTTLTASDLDTGSFVAGYYYIYVCGGNTGTSPVFKISASSSAPSGYSIYKKIGWFYNEASGSLNISSEQLGNVRDTSNNPNMVKAEGTSDISTTSASYVDMPDMELKFYSSGRRARINWSGDFRHVPSGHIGFMRILIDDTEKRKLYDGRYDDRSLQNSFEYFGDLAEGTHTIKVQWKAYDSTTVYQYGATRSKRVLVVEEV